MAGSTEDQVVEDALDALKKLDLLEKQGQIKSKAYDSLLSYLYKPDPQLKTIYLEFERLWAAKEVAPKADKESLRRKCGEQLELLAATLMSGLRKWSVIKSLFTAGPQYDLLIAGDGIQWNETAKRIFPQKKKGDTILVEAKATVDKISEQQFSRMCSLLDHNLKKTAFMGIFFCITGATGFGEKGSPRVSRLTASHLKQVLFFLKRKKPIVVLDLFEIAALVDGQVNLIQMLRSKIRQIEVHCGKAYADVLKPGECPREIDLPGHLSSLVSPPPPKGP